MKARDIRQMTSAEIQQRIKEDEENLSMMKFQQATSQLTNTSKIQSTKRDLARMNTVLTERTKEQETHS